MNVVGDLSMQKRKEKLNRFLFCHCLKNPYASWWILSLHYLNLVNAVQSICSFMSDVLLYLQILSVVESYQEKMCMTCWQEKVLARVLMVQSFGQIVHSFFAFFTTPLIAFNVSGPRPSVFFIFVFALSC